MTYFPFMTYFMGLAISITFLSVVPMRGHGFTFSFGSNKLNIILSSDLFKHGYLSNDLVKLDLDDCIYSLYYVTVDENAESNK